MSDDASDGDCTKLSNEIVGIQTAIQSVRQLVSQSVIEGVKFRQYVVWIQQKV